VSELCHFKQEAIHLSKRRPIGADTIAVPIGVAITAMATLITAMATLIMAMGTTGHMVITAMAGDQASPSVSDVAGVGAIKRRTRALVIIGV